MANSFFSRTVKKSVTPNMLRHFGEQVTYVRGAETFAVKVREVALSFDAIDVNGAVIETRSREFLIGRTSKPFCGTTKEPLEGDRIQFTESGVDKVFELADTFGQQHFRIEDEQGIDFRIYTKEVAS